MCVCMWFPAFVLLCAENNYLLVKLLILLPRAYQLDYNHMDCNVKPHDGIPVHLTFGVKNQLPVIGEKVHWKTTACLTLQSQSWEMWELRVSAQLKWFWIVSADIAKALVWMWEVGMLGSCVCCCHMMLICCVAGELCVSSAQFFLWCYKVVE